MVETTVRADDKQRRGYKRKTRTQISGDSTFGYPSVDERSDAIHQKRNCRIDTQQDWNQNGGPKHRRQMLKAER